MWNRGLKREFCFLVAPGGLHTQPLVCSPSSRRSPWQLPTVVRGFPAWATGVALPGLWAGEVYLGRVFALHIPEEGGLGSEEAILQVLLQAAGPRAHAAVHRHLAGSRAQAARASAGPAGDAAQGGGDPPGRGRASSEPAGGPGRRGGPVGCAAIAEWEHLLPGSRGLCGFMSPAPAPSLRPARRAPSRHLPRALPAPWQAQPLRSHFL